MIHQLVSKPRLRRRPSRDQFQQSPLLVFYEVTQANVGQVERMADLFARHEIVMWSVFFLVPVGRAGRMARLSADGCEQAFAALWQESQRQPYAIKTTEAPHYRRYAIQHQLAQPGARPTGYVPLGVNDGKGVMFVGHTGIVHPSGFLPIVCGLFPLQHLVQIYQQSPVFRALRDAERLEGKCHACEFRQICGGSRARAYAVTDNLFAQEPDCSYIPQTKSPASGPIMTRNKPASVQQLVDEHGHLHQSLERIRQALSDRQATREVIVATFGELTRRVLNHFEHEEEGGYFADAIQASPWLGQRARDLLREHAEMAAQLAFLQQCAGRDSENEGWWATLEEEFADFFTDFTAHEAAENALLQDAYSDDIGTGD